MYIEGEGSLFDMRGCEGCVNAVADMSVIFSLPVDLAFYGSRPTVGESAVISRAFDSSDIGVPGVY